MSELADKIGGVKKPRNQNIEVLRCLLMFLIVLFHGTKFGIYGESHATWMFFFSALLIWHVDCFVGISGWFGIRPTFMKFLKLWGVVAFYSVVSYLWQCWNGDCGIRNLKLCGGWFVGAYLALMLIAPLLNAAVEGLVAKSPSTYWKAWALAFVMMTLAWIPGNLFTGVSPVGVSGISFFVICFVYVTARGLHLAGLKKVHLPILLAGVAVFVMLSAGLQFARYAISVRHGAVAYFSDASSMVHYGTPHVIIMAMIVLLLFASHVHAPKWLGSLAAFCGPSMFAVYLLHGPCSFGHATYRGMQTLLASSTSLHPMLIVSLSALVVFTGCVGVDLLRRGGVMLICKVITRSTTRSAQ